MTDNKSLFRSSLVLIKRRTISVGGGQLFADCKGIAELYVQGSGSILVSDVLYVPNLGANLLSSKKLCSRGLTFTSDDKLMTFWRDRTKVLEASANKGVYVLSWVKPNLKDYAFSAISDSDNPTEQ
jgi:hypothetical protein